MADQEASQEANQHEDNPLPGAPGSEEELDSAPITRKQGGVTDEELRALQQELSEYKDKYLRFLAEGENARKRLQKERQDMTRHAMEGLMIDFLRPLDNFEHALRFAQDTSDEVRNWALGFQMILVQFRDVLAQNGMTSFESAGQLFNPHDHEAIEMIETSDYPPGTIIEESVKGYKIGDRTIRAARVKVAKIHETI